MSRASGTVCLLVAVLLCSCSSRPRLVGLESPPGLEPRLAALLERCPLPSTWRLAGQGEGIDAIVSLAAVEFGPAAGGPGTEATASRAGAFEAGDAWLAPAADLADPIYTLSETEARAHGLEYLEAIAPPRRALRVEGRWPGEEGYPFRERLLLAARSASGRREPRDLRRWAERAAAAASASGERPAILGAVGDLQAGPLEAPALAAGGSRNAELLRDGLDRSLARTDALVGNLEGVVSARGKPNPRKRFLFRMPPGTARSLRSAGFDLVLLGNNHVFDFGDEAFLDTMSELDEAGLPYVGAGKELSEALELKTLDIPGSRPLAFVGFASFPEERLGFAVEEAAAAVGHRGINADEAATIEAIIAASAAGQAVVVLAHGGAEYQALPADYLRARYRRFADAGAALVIGSHPHVLQGAEARGRSLIAYSLGNFLFTGLEEPPLSLRSAALAFLMYGGVARGLALEPVIVDPRGTSPDPDLEGAERRFAAACAALTDKGGRE